MALAATATFGLGLEAQRKDDRQRSPVVATVAVISELAVLLIATM
jgi:hypothetical protein